MAGGRPPPQDLAAEESLLGAMLLTSAAIEASVGIVTDDSYYKPAHGHIHHAIVALYDRGEPVDPITVADELRRAGLLEAIGGPASLISLQANVGATTNAGRYAHIVIKHARHRRMIAVGAEIIELGYRDDSTGDQAQELVARIVEDSDGSGNDGWPVVDLEGFLTGTAPDDGPTLGTRRDGRHLLYEGRVHSFNGEPESGKSWAAQAIVAELLAAGHVVVYLDFEDSPGPVAQRIRSLGVRADLIAANLIYIRPEAPYSAQAGASLTRLIAHHRPTLAVVDGVTEAMALHGLNPYENLDVARWWADIPRPFARAGAAVILIDHVTKDRENRGRWAIGAQHKLAAVDGAAFTFETTKPFGRGTVGTARITITKDRPGHLRQHAIGGVIADFRLESWPDEACAAAFETPASSGEFFRPTVLMEKVSRYIEEHPGMSKRGILGAVPGDDKAKTLAVEILLNEGFIAVEKVGQAHHHSSVKAFRNVEETHEVF